MYNRDVKKLTRIAAGLDGIFTIADLRVLYGEDSVATRFRKIESLVKEGELIKVMRGLYALPDADLKKVSYRSDPDSVISMGTVLAEEGLIGTVPARRVWAVRVGRPRTISCSLGIIQQLSIAPRVLTGWEWRNGIRYAVPEKAYLDAWYFQYKGRKLPFDLLEDVNRDRLSPKKLTSFLAAYDVRFQRYYQRGQEEEV